MARDLHRAPSNRTDKVVRITTAATSREEDIRTRQRRYVLSMTIRTLCFVGAIVAAISGVGWLWPILIVAALLLPYVAVVMANATSTKDDGFALQAGAFGARELGGESETEPETAPDPEEPER